MKILVILFSTMLMIHSAAFPQNARIKSKIDSLKIELKQAEYEQKSIDARIVYLKSEIDRNWNLYSSSTGKSKVKCKGGSLMSKPTYDSKVLASIPSDGWVILNSAIKSNGYVQVEYETVTGFIIESALQKQANVNSLLTDPSPSESSNSPAEEEAKPTQGTQKASSPHKPSSSRTYYRGPRGGCYYINSSGNKQYVDHSFCN